jgi:hypothetical protein
VDAREERESRKARRQKGNARTFFYDRMTADLFEIGTGAVQFSEENEIGRGRITDQGMDPKRVGSRAFLQAEVGAAVEILIVRACSNREKEHLGHAQRAIVR